jgi:hypothetical protein
MIRILTFAFIAFLAACVPFPDGSAANTPAARRGWQGDPCQHDSDCNTLWCANSRCTIRDP